MTAARRKGRTPMMSVGVRVRDRDGCGASTASMTRRDRRTRRGNMMLSMVTRMRLTGGRDDDGEQRKKGDERDVADAAKQAQPD